MNERTELEEYLIEKCAGLEAELKTTREEIFELHANLIYYRQFYSWAKNRLEEEGILLTEHGIKKPSEMTKAELIARNELTVRKQENRISDLPPNLPKQPGYKESIEKYAKNIAHEKYIIESDPLLKQFLELIGCKWEVKNYLDEFKIEENKLE
jgi:hypothetical protein